MSNGSTSSPARSLDAATAVEPRRAALGGPGKCGVVLLVVGLVLAAYSNSLDGPLLFDDYRYLGSLEKLNELDRHLTRSLRPLLFLTLDLNYRFAGSSAWAFHATNLVVHVTAALLLGGLVRRTLESPRLAGGYAEGQVFWLAVGVAALWAAHPLGTQAVTYIIQRGESLASLFYLATLYGLARAAAGGRYVRLWAAASVLACWAGFASKEIAATAPAAALAYDRVFFASSWSELRRRRGWIYFGYLAPLLWFAPIFVRSFVWQGASMGFGYKGIGPFEYAANQPPVILHYLRLVFWPDPLCFDYAWRRASSWSELVLPGVVIGAALAVGAGLLFRRRPLGWLVAVFFLILAPTSSFVPIADLAFEHRMYLPSAAVIAATTLGLHAWIRGADGSLDGRRTRAANLVVGGLLLLVTPLAAWRTFERNRDYRDPERLWRSVLAASPHNPRAHYNLAVELASQGRTLDAARLYLRAVELKPDYAIALAAYARCLEQLGRSADAVVCYRRILHDMPPPPNEYLTAVHADYGVSLERIGESAQAEQAYREALRIDGSNLPARFNLGRLLVGSGRDGEGQTLLRRVLEVRPDMRVAARHLAWSLATAADAERRDSAEAVRLAEAVVAAGSDERPRPHTYDVLGAAYAAAGRFQPALDAARKAEAAAQAAGDSELAAAIAARRRLYEAGAAFYRSPADGPSAKSAASNVPADPTDDSSQP